MLFFCFGFYVLPEILDDDGFTRKYERSNIKIIKKNIKRKKTNNKKQ